MTRSAPGFWSADRPTWVAHLLAPAGTLYGAVTAHRMGRPGHESGVPVLCIGNFVVGGAGKTPVALHVVQRLTARGLRPAILSRGYGRRGGGPALLRVDPRRHGAADVGDEPLLLARLAPTYVAADRVAAARAAVGDGATILVLDDGLQSPALQKTASIVVVDGAAGVGNGLCLPAGPLRAPLSVQWRFVAALCVVGAGEAGDALAADAGRRALPVLRARLEPQADAVTALQGRRFLAFSGIGRPEKFFRTAEQSGLEVVGRRSFPDHHLFGPQDRYDLSRAAERLGAELLTTEKDRVRLPAEFPARVLPVTLRLDDPGILDDLVDRLGLGHDPEP